MTSHAHILREPNRAGQETAAAQIVRLIDATPVGETRMQDHAERLADRLVVPCSG